MQKDTEEQNICDFIEKSGCEEAKRTERVSPSMPSQCWTHGISTCVNSFIHLF